MRVLLNAASAKMGGSVTYLTHLIPYLGRAGNRHDFILLLPAETAALLSRVPPNVALIPTTCLSWWKRIWWEQVTLRRLLRQRRTDVLVSTGNFGMLLCPVTQVLLIRNALYFSAVYQKEFLPRHSWRTRLSHTLRRWLICLSVRHADVVITPTHAMLAELRKWVRVPEGKAQVNPCGGPLIEQGDPPACSPPVAQKKHNGARLLFVSLYCEHKNLGTLLQALKILNENGGQRYWLRTTADPNWSGGSWTVTHREDAALARDPGVKPWLEFLPVMTPMETQALYGEADVFVFPSRVESWGHPLVEAMSYGLPVVAADTAVNREVCGEAAVYFNPLMANELATAVRQVVADGSLRERLSSAGRERVRAKYRWEEHTSRLVAAAAEAAGKRSPRKGERGSA